MNKFILRIALFLGLFLVGFTSPALAQRAGYATMDLTLKVSGYSGNTSGQVGVSEVRQPENFTKEWSNECSVHIDASEAKYRGENVYNDVTIFAKANPGYTFLYWAESDDVSSKPAKASFGKEIQLWKNILGYYTKYMLAENPGRSGESYAKGGVAALFRYHVYGTFLDTHNSSRTLYAVFEPATYTVTFVTNGGAVSTPSKQVTYKEKYGALPTPTKTGHTFAGWYLDETCTSSPVDANTTCTTTNDHNLYAKWTPINHTIHFVDEESGAHSSIPNATYSGTTMPTLIETTYKLTWDAENKYFAGYYTKPNGAGDRVYAGIGDGTNLTLLQSLTLTSDITLYAHYSHVHHKMYWDYSYDNGTKEQGSETTWHNMNSSEYLKYARLTFKKANGAVIKTIILEATAPTEVKPIGSMTSDITTHTTSLADIHLHVGSQSDVLDAQTVDVYFTDEQLASFAAYTFEAISAISATPADTTVATNWVVTTHKDTHNTVLNYIGATGTNIYSQAWSVELNGLLINPDYIYVMPLYWDGSKWAAISQLVNTYGVQCIKSNETPIDAQGHKKATYAGTYPVWIKDNSDNYYRNAIGLVGFNLGGKDYWMNTTAQGTFEPFYTSAGATSPFIVSPASGENTGADATKDVTIEYTVPASKIPVIHFLPNGGELSPATPQYLVSAYGATVTLKESETFNYSATRPGYAFNGWKIDDSEGGTMAGNTLTMNQAYTLHAQWNAISYNVTIHKNDGSDPEVTTQITANYMAAMPAISAPTRTGYTFMGCWDVHDKQYYKADGTSYQPYDKTADCDLYAGWQANQYDVTLNHNGGTSSTDQVTATYDAVLPTVEVPERNGFNFLGYFDDETAGTQYIDVNGNGCLAWNKTANTTLYAHWEKYTYYYETSDGIWSDLDMWKIGTSSDPSQHQAATALPTENSDVVVSKTLIIDTEEACYSLTIEDGGSVTIAPTGGLSVGAGGVTGATASNFRIQSSTDNQGYFRMSPSATTAMPTATVEYATKGTLDTGADKDATWQYFGVPVTVNNYTCDYITWLNQYDAERGWISLRDGQAHTLEPWKGYCITQYGQPVYEWSGQLINEDKNITLATQGMNHLIANSYSAPIDVTQFTGTDFLGNLERTFYIYNAGSWNKWKTNKGTDPSQSDHAPGTYTAIPVLAAEWLEGEQTMIAPMQAIMVRNMGTDPVTILFDYAKHVWAAEANHGSNMTDPIRAPHRAAANPADELTARVRLSVGSANSGVDHLYMLEKPDFTGDYDNGYDAPKMATRGLVNLYSTVQDGMLAVDAKDQLENTYVGFAAGSDSEYSLHFSAVLGTEYYLLDQQTGICTQMAEGAHYDFSATPNSIDDYRFIILRQSPGISTTLPNVSDSESPVTEIYTISGLRMDLPQSKLPKGIYIIRQGQTVNKIAIQ